MFWLDNYSETFKDASHVNALEKGEKERQKKRKKKHTNLQKVLANVKTNEKMAWICEWVGMGGGRVDNYLPVCSPTGFSMF
jgi:hypothetical protein